MSNPVATVLVSTGQVWARSPDGQLRPLSEASRVYAEDVIVTTSGANVELSFDNDQPMSIGADQEVAMSRDLWLETATGADEAALDQETLEALAALELGGDLLENLEETAAGNAVNGGGISFVQLARIVSETPDPADFDYLAENIEQPQMQFNQGEAPNRPPEVEDLHVIGDEDSEITGVISATDPDGDELAYELLTPPANGTLILDPITGQFTYVPEANYHGADSFVVTVSDSHGNSVNTQVTISVNAVNDAPVTRNLTIETAEDLPVEGEVVASDIDGDELTYTVATNPTNGTVTLDAATGKFIYTPNANYNGSDSFDIVISDGKGGTTTSTVTIEVTPVNDAPTATPISLTTDEDVPASGQVLASDIDGDALSYSIATNPTNGTVTLDAVTGQFIYTPNANYNGNDSFDVVISDGKGGTTTSTVTIEVTPVNDAPTTAPVSLMTDEDVPASGQVLASDIDGDALSYSVATNPTNGTVTLDAATGEFIYTPNANYNGNDSFDVFISDGKGGTTTSTVTIEVTPVNDAPTTAPVSLITDEDVPASGQIIAHDIDSDVLNYSVATNPTNGTVTLDAATGKFIYTPNANYNGNDSFDVVISDDKGGTTTSTVTIEVTPVNHAPTTAPVSLITDEDVPASGQVLASDIDSDVLNYSVATNPTNGTVTLDAMTGKFIYTPNANYNGNDSFDVVISDGKGGTTTSTVTIEVTPVNDAPTATPISLTTDEDVPASGQVLASDIDGDALNYSIATNPTNGTVTLDAATGEFIYTPNANYNGNDSFDVVISDGKGGTATSTVTIEVTPVNDAPTTAPVSLMTDEDVPASGQIIAHDIDSDVLNYSVATNPTNGTVTLDAATGKFIYTPNANYNGNDSFDVVISDGKGGTTTSTVTIEVTPVNDAPTATPISLTTDEDVPASGQVLASDIDGDALSYSIATNPTNGTVTLDAATGKFIYTPNANYNGNDSFDVVISDGKGGTATSTVTIEVTPVNDAPTTAPVLLITDEDVPASGQVLASDIDGDALSYSVATNPTNGTVTLDAVTGKFIYTPNANYNGNDSFDVVISDGKGGTTTSTVSVEVTPVNALPSLVTNYLAVTPVKAAGLTVDFYNYAEGTDGPNLTNLAMARAFIDAKNSNATFTSTTLNYAVGDGNLGTGNNLENWIGSDSGSLEYSNQQSTGDAILNAKGKIFLEAGWHVFRVTADDGYSITIGDNSAGKSDGNQSVTQKTHHPFFIREAGWHDIDVLYWDQGAKYALQIELSSDGGATFSPLDGSILRHDQAGQEYRFTAADLLANAIDPDGDALVLTGVSNAVGGSASFDAATGEIIFVPQAGFNGHHSFDYSVTDGSGVAVTATTYVAIVDNNIASNDYVQGTLGDDQLHGSSGNDFLDSASGDDILFGGDGDDILLGGLGDDILLGGAGDDVLVGGAGSDILVGGIGADVFAWELADISTDSVTTDFVHDFNPAEGDVLDLADLLQGEESAALTDYLHFAFDGADTTLHISSQGSYGSGGYNAALTDQIIVLEGVNLVGSLSNTDIIDQLKNTGSLQVD